MSLADRYRHWQQAAEDEVVHYDTTAPEPAPLGEWGIVANVLWDRILRMGTKVYLLGWHGDYEFVKVQGLSKGGKTIRKYLPFKRLRTFRAAWLPPPIRTEAWFHCATKAEAVAIAARLEALWPQVQFYTTEGVCLRPGLTMGEAFRWLQLSPPEEPPDASG
jgi:hypothetical protein